MALGTWPVNSFPAPKLPVLLCMLALGCSMLRVQVSIGRWDPSILPWAWLGRGFLRGHCLVQINSREMGMNFPCPPWEHPEARPGVWQGKQVVLEHPRTSQGKGPAPAPPAALGSGPGGMLPAIAQAFLGDVCLSLPPPAYRTSPELPDERQETATYLI